MNTEEKDEGQQRVGGQITGMRLMRAGRMRRLQGGSEVEQRDVLTLHGFQGTKSLILPEDRHSSVKM